MRAGVVVVGLLGTALAGCSSDEPEAEPTTTTAPAPAPAAATVPPTTAARTTNPKLLDVNEAWRIDGDRAYTDEETRIVEAYIRAEQAMVIAGLAPPDPDWPGLDETMTGQHLDRVKSITAADAAAGRAKTDPAAFRIITGRIQHESPTTVVVQACYISNWHPYELATGRLLEEDLPYAAYLGSRMVLIDGTWKQDLSAEVKRWPGLARCADPLP